MWFSLKKKGLLQWDPWNPGFPEVVHKFSLCRPRSPQSQPFSPEGTQLTLPTDLRVFNFHAQVLTDLLIPPQHIPPVAPFPCHQKLLMSPTPASATAPNLSSVVTSFSSSQFYLWNDAKLQPQHFSPLLSYKELLQLSPTIFFFLSFFKKIAFYFKHNKNWGNMNDPVHGWKGKPHYITKKIFKCKHSSLLMTYLGLIL